MNLAESTQLMQKDIDVSVPMVEFDKNQARLTWNLIHHHDQEYRVDQFYHVLKYAHTFKVKNAKHLPKLQRLSRDGVVFQ